MDLPAIKYVPSDDLFPELGVANITEQVCLVRDDLPLMVRKGVIAHEMGHLKMRTRSEMPALIYGFLTAPFASLSVVIYTLLNRRQRNGILAEISRR